jgi:hypothetical protein
MSAKYCLKCGTRNELDASFCKKCGTSFSTQKEPLPEPALSEEDQEEKLTRIKKRKKVNRAMASAPVPEEELGITIGLPTEENDDDEGEGVSLNYCPQVERLEIESLQVDQVKGIKFGDLVEAAKREQAQKGSSVQP